MISFQSLQVRLKGNPYNTNKKIVMPSTLTNNEYLDEEASIRDMWKGCLNV